MSLLTRLPRPLSLSLPSLVLPSLAHAFSSSPPALESKSRRKARLTRKTHLEKKAALARSHALGAPDPVLGHARGQGGLWEQSLLKSVLLDRREVWGDVVRVLPDEKGGVLAQEVKGEKREAQGGRLLNFGLKPEEVAGLAEALPLVAAYQTTVADGGMPNSEAIRQARFDTALVEENAKRDRLLRIVDLRNAGSKGIEVENTRRIVAAFGASETDTGSPEVQAAILTARIHSLTTHLTTQPRDVHNRRPLRSLVQQRAKVLKYLRSLDVKRYEVCLAKIGVEPRAVEGEVIVTKLGLRSIIRGV